MKKIASIALSLVMLLTMSVPAFAAETDTRESTVLPITESVKSAETVDTESYTVNVTVNGEEVPVVARSSISGYGQGSVRIGSTMLEIPLSSSGFGGTGATITTSCSSGTFATDIVLAAGPSTEYGCYTMGRYKNASTNGTYYLNNMIHYDDTDYVWVYLEGINPGTVVNLQVWIYG